MAEMPDEDPPVYHDYALAAMLRMDPEKLAAVRRAMTGMTRCPECDALNRADQPRCDKCGAKLYPEVPDNQEEKAVKDGYEDGY